MSISYGWDKDEYWDVTTRSWKKKEPKPKKGDAVKKYNDEEKSWDYEILGEEDWKPNWKYMSKKPMEQDSLSIWFNIEDLSTLEDIQNYKDKIKKDFYSYDKINNLKKHMILKRYATAELIENYFYYFIKKYPKKNIYKCNKILDELYVEKPTLERLKYRRHIDVDTNVSKLSSDEFNIVTYWVMKDSIVFRN